MYFIAYKFTWSKKGILKILPRKRYLKNTEEDEISQHTYAT